MIVNRVERYLATQIKQWPCHTNRASEIGHECDRYLVFTRTRWQEKSLHNIDLEFIFREGRVQEKAVLDLLSEAGVEVIEQQRPFDWREYQITGHIDGKVVVNGKPIPLEIKSMHPMIWQKIGSIDDLINSKMIHLRRYPAQLTIYMLCSHSEQGLFLFKNKSTGQLKEILFDLDYEYGESIIQKAERVNAAISGGITPAPIPWGDTCERCSFRHICITEALREELEFRVDPEAEEKIDGWFELRQWHDQWTELDEWRKDHFRGVAKLVIGDKYLITGKSYGKDDKGWKTNITKIGA